jgi:dipeptidyl aminopeptidase/acylaminoacyl peptidase
MTHRPLRYLPLLLLFCQHQAFARTASEVNQQIAMSRAVKEIALSPRGRTVVSVITDTTASGGHGHLWTLSKSERPKQITGTGDDRAAEDSGPVWAPDGRTLLYRRKMGDASTINRIDVDSGRVDTLNLSRQGSGVAGGWGTRPAGKPVIARGFATAPSSAIAVWAANDSRDPEKEAHKEDQHLFGQSEQVRLYVVDESGPREITLDDNVRSVTWSKDSRSLLVVTEPVSDDLGALNRLWLIEKDQPPREIRGTAQNVQAASWLADGRIAYFARCSRDAPIVCQDLFVQSLDGSKPHNLTESIDGSLIAGLDGSTTTGPVVTTSGDLLVTIARHFDQQVARIRPADGRITWIDSLPTVVKAVTTNADQTGFALLAADRGALASIQLADARLRSTVRVVSPQLQPADWMPLKGRHLEWVSDDRTIDGLLYMPASATSEKHVPLIVNVHGGPAGRFEDSDYPLVRLLLEEGWAVLHVNPRGSFGYGVEFLASLKDDLGGADYRDIMTGVDAALAQDSIDKQRLALIGYSYGATMTSFALGRTNRFKALVAVAPVVDQISEYGTEGSSWYDRWYFGKPWTRLEAAWRQSPLAGAAAARTPLLLLHGESDTVNPLGQSLELYRALRQEGSPVELILFPRETHREIGQNFFGYPSIEPHHGIALRQRILDFVRDAFSRPPHTGLTTGDRQ